MLFPKITITMGTILSWVIRKIVYMMKCGVPDRHELYIDIFALDIGNGVPVVVHLKKLRIQANTICCNLEE